MPPGLAPFVDRLRKDPAFSLVTQTMVIPSGSLGMEALRENAARYRLRYILLYREVLGRREVLGPWAWGYATVVGALFLPGQKQDIRGYIEASMFDVKTGLLMFTTRRSITASQSTNRWQYEQSVRWSGVRVMQTLHRFRLRTACGMGAPSPNPSSPPRADLKVSARGG